MLAVVRLLKTRVTPASARPAQPRPRIRNFGELGTHTTRIRLRCGLFSNRQKEARTKRYQLSFEKPKANTLEPQRTKY